ncbi:MAG TPA: hydroxyisourate hydrolase [Candidatus Limnocylindrales bacterium]|nr:hydroxyisourate hydrolase [Candidatus Limnocylindrales bacterium]
MAEPRPTISTHVLDASAGMPAKGIQVRLGRIVDDGAEIPAGRGTTDADGRISHLLNGELTAGDYRLTFWIGGRGGFFERISLDLHIDDAARSYHVPLLLSPFSMTTYRGS